MPGSNLRHVMSWNEPTRCRLCGNTDRYALRQSLVKWRDAEPGMFYDWIDRCKDEAACRERAELLDEPWPLAERKAS